MSVTLARRVLSQGQGPLTAKRGRGRALATGPLRARFPASDLTRPVSARAQPLPRATRRATSHPTTPAFGALRVLSL